LAKQLEVTGVSRINYIIF